MDLKQPIFYDDIMTDWYVREVVFEAAMHRTMTYLLIFLVTTSETLTPYLLNVILKTELHYFLSTFVDRKVVRYFESEDLVFIEPTAINFDLSFLMISSSNLSISFSIGF
jgi:hypothetical protein